MNDDIFWPLALAAMAGMATFAGGWMTMRLTRLLGAVLGLCAGIVLGVAVLELAPQALSLSQVAGTRTLAWLAIGCGLMSLPLTDRLLPRLGRRVGRIGGHIGPASLTLHSLIDGAGIGLAFHLSTTAGWSVAIAVLTHDLADGINIVGLALARGTSRAAWRWLCVNAAAPLIGTVLALSTRLPASSLAVVLGLLSGLFAAIALTELVPRSLKLNGPIVAAASAACGMLAVYAWIGVSA